MSTPKVTAFRFNAAEVKPASLSDILPGGWYRCQVEEIELVASRKKAEGQRIPIVFAVIDGDYKGRKIFGGFNIKNANPEAQRIANEQFSALCHAVNIIDVSDLSAFVGKVVDVRVKVKKASAEDKDAGYDDKNEPTGFKAVEGANAAPVMPGFMQAAPGIPAAPGVPTVPGIAAAPAFPPVGWQPHPTAPGYYFSGQEVLTEADLRARIAPPPAPVAPPAPIAPPMPPTPPTPPPVAVFPPAGWLAHPNAPGWFYNSANPAEMLAEADLRAKTVIAAPVAPPMPPTVPGVPGVPVPPAVVAGSPPPWETPA